MSKRKLLSTITLYILLIFLIIVVYFLKFYKTPESANEADKLNYDSVVNDESKSYLGKEITWRGRISNLSQIDGIKFWIVDNNHTIRISSYNDWFWAIPKETPTTSETNGNWPSYMLKKYGNLNLDNIVIESDTFTITGTLLELDCNFYSSTLKKCIPNVVVKSIKIDE